MMDLGLWNGGQTIIKMAHPFLVLGPSAKSKILAFGVSPWEACHSKQTQKRGESESRGVKRVDIWNAPPPTPPKDGGRETFLSRATGNQVGGGGFASVWNGTPLRVDESVLVIPKWRGGLKSEFCVPPFCLQQTGFREGGQNAIVGDLRRDRGVRNPGNRTHQVTHVGPLVVGHGEEHPHRLEGLLEPRVAVDPCGGNHGQGIRLLFRPRGGRVSGRHPPKRGRSYPGGGGGGPRNGRAALLVASLWGLHEWDKPPSHCFLSGLSFNPTHHPI